MTSIESRQTASPAAPRAQSPLRRPVFRALWVATVVSNVGTWMNDVAAAWVMTTLTPNPLLVALVQTATTLPMFLLALPAGALADIVDRRRYLLTVQVGAMAAATALAVTAYLGALSPVVLLLLVFGLGVTAALNAPAWQATTPELVPREELSAAVALNSAAVNVSRSVGPALGGAILAAAGPAPAFALNAVSFVGILWVLARWRRPRRESTLPVERFFGALAAGLRYVRGSPPLRAVLVRAGGFFLFASATMALLPVLARVELGRGPGGYATLLTLLGLGALGGAWLLPRLRRRLSADAVVASASLAFAASTAALALLVDFRAACGASLVAGAAWIAVLSSLNVAAQGAVPSWVRARALSVYLVVFFGSMASGSVVWGAVASRFGTPAALAAAAAGLAVGVLATRGFALAREEADLSPSGHWPAPAVAEEPAWDQGPVLVTTEYRVAPEKAGEFSEAMAELRRMRRRGGAVSWALFQDAADPARFVELFLVESWVGHLRQHERVTVADRQVQEGVAVFHLGGTPPAVSHFVAVSPSGGRKGPSRKEP